MTEDLDITIPKDNVAGDNPQVNAEPIVGQGDNPQPTPQEIAFAYLNENGIEAKSIDELKKGTEKIVNLYEDVLDDDDKAYLQYKKETGRGRKDYEKINSNIDETPKLELARERVRRESGENYTNEKIDEYITDVLGIDLEDMSASDEIKLAAYTKSILEEKRAEQEKYKRPIEKKPDNNPDDYVRLENNSIMLKSDYENLTKNRQKSIEDSKEAVNSVTATNFKIDIDDNGTIKEQNYVYEYSEKDKHSMLSMVSDIDAEIAKDYNSEKGFDRKQFAEDMFWRNKNNREKAIASIIHKAIAGNTEEVLKLRGNVNFSQNQPITPKTNEGVKMVSFKDIIDRI